LLGTEKIYQDSFTLNLKHRLFYTEVIISKTFPANRNLFS
jgi:hypothetical protein